MVVDKMVARGEYMCITIEREIQRVLRCRGLIQNNHKYEFSVLDKKHYLSFMLRPNYKGGMPRFYLPLYLLEAWFLLLLHQFVMNLLNSNCWHPAS